MNKQELENRIEGLESELNKLKEELNKPVSKVWKPKYNDIYYYIYCNSVVCECVWKDDKFDEGLWAIGNCFETKEEAEFEVERLKVIAELKRFAQEHNEPIDWQDDKQFKSFVVFEGHNERIDYCWSVRCKRNDIYFSTKELAKQAVEQIGEDRVKKYYLGVEE